MTARVRIVAWQPEWPRLFEEERARLSRVFDGVEVAIEHVGSTSVAGLAAKPIIDICVGVASLEIVEARIPGLEALGYSYVPRYEAQMPERRYFRRPADHPRSHHVHCFVKGGVDWSRHIRFRDRLRASPALVAEYAGLKRRLAEAHGDDRAGYTEAKSSFIEAALAEALPDPPRRTSP